MISFPPNTSQNRAIAPWKANEIARDEREEFMETCKRRSAAVLLCGSLFMAWSCTAPGQTHAENLGVTGHPPNEDVTLNLVSMADKKTKVLAKLFGGQGTINVPSWSPDSTKVAFVSYEYIPDQTRD